MRDMKDSGIEWIGEIPAHWEKLKIKNAVVLIGSGTTPSSGNSLYYMNGNVFWIQSGDIYGKSVIENTTTMVTEFAIHSIPALRMYTPPYIVVAMYGGSVGNIAVSEIQACVNQACCCIMPDSKNDLKFMYYWLITCRSDFLRISDGGGQPNISQSKIRNQIYLQPPIDEQKRIAAYLDKKCDEIRLLCNDIQSQISSLEEYKRSVITEAVTKGLNADVEMKDSGVEWIGQIPKKWETIKIGRIFSLRNERNFLPEEEVQLLSLYTGIGVFPQGEHTTASGNHAQTVMGYKVVHKNDIVVNIILAWMGAIGVSDYDGVTSPAYDVYIPDLKKVVPHYFHYVFRTSGIAGECYKYGRGIMMMRWRTYSQEFKQIIVPFPSLEEQKIIAGYLDTKCTEIDNAILEKKKQLETLEQYKKSLIYEYVTGKKEVPNE